MKTDSLFEAQNPLEERLGKSFFDELPKTSGVYKMYGCKKSLLYVGKAKNLRSRLFTYRRVNNDNSSRKVRRLVRLVRQIALEELPSEEKALLRENELIRRHRPPFNRAKKTPETYYYVSAVPKNKVVTFQLRMHLPEEHTEYTYGAFKGHGRVRRAMGALLRQLYITTHGLNTPFDLPGQLSQKFTPMYFQLELNRDKQLLVRDYLQGLSDELLYVVIDDHIQNNRLEEFIGKLILKDMEALRWFYGGCTHRNFEIREKLNLDDELIPQEKLDDYLVRLAFME
ncbi:nucleotide excision repair endonuclease [Aliifodinibius salicampi]|uniref:Excinuclease cho n=1 Tax=Fodinibius salicampi TaxID=1920655 RepID=A0ABT3PZP3_9BACT|nr:nucleotide excision repair endonuclease [Fodinibius salicampi]MCW9713339.1 nucleotide excision repair endonuclease [Fodinibius salicampi]